MRTFILAGIGFVIALTPLWAPGLIDWDPRLTLEGVFGTPSYASERASFLIFALLGVAFWWLTDA